MIPVRDIQRATHFKKVPSSNGQFDLWGTCSPDEQGAQSLTWDKLRVDELYLAPVTMVSCGLQLRYGERMMLLLRRLSWKL